jgi:glyoxylase-like metal-dependent hydrolase (beta-lactamase superfamily II)
MPCRSRSKYFTGNGAGFGRSDSTVKPDDITPDQLVTDVTSLSVGGTDFALYPTPGGETADALMVYLPASGVLLAGDVTAGQPRAATAQRSRRLALPRRKTTE